VKKKKKKALFLKNPFNEIFASALKFNPSYMAIIK
jgi:hypothetical protein